MLDQLLDSQDRLTNAEFIYSQAELELKLSEVGLRRVMGTLLLFENVTYTKTIEDGSPAYSIGQGEISGDPAGTWTPGEPGQTPFNDTEMMSPEQLRQLQSPPSKQVAPDGPSSTNEPTTTILKSGSRSFRYPLGDSPNR